STSLMLLALLMSAEQPSGHEHGIGSADLRPRIGVLTEEVVRQKLKSYGREIMSFEQGQDKFIARVRVDGQPAVLEINRLTGAVLQDGESVSMPPAPNADPLPVRAG